MSESRQPIDTHRFIFPPVLLFSFYSKATAVTAFEVPEGLSVCHVPAKRQNWEVEIDLISEGNLR